MVTTGPEPKLIVLGRIMPTIEAMATGRMDHVWRHVRALHARIEALECGLKAAQTQHPPVTVERLRELSNGTHPRIRS